MPAVEDEPYTCSIARIIAFFSSRKSRSSYPYRLWKPVSVPRPYYSRRHLYRRPQPWMGPHLKCSCSPEGPHFLERGSFSFSGRLWPSSFLTLISLIQLTCPSARFRAVYLTR